MEHTQIHVDLGVREMLDSLRQSKLLTDQEIERADRAAGAEAATGPALARALIGNGLLTEFQIDAIRTRKFSDLRIGNYDVLDRLGAGGMGTVFKARHRRMKRVVALKVLAAKLAKDELFVQRFQREVETIARLSHPNIVMAFDADEDAVGHFLVMEFVDGKDLASVVQAGGPLSVTAAVNAILHAARGLEYAHAQNIIHRDIKPANLLMDAHGTVKVTDLGLARLAKLSGDSDAPAAGGITQAGGVLGTVDYMPPEQAVDSTTLDQRADIYSLGATLHFLLTGCPPYQGQTLMATLLMHREAPIPSLSAARKDVPSSLDAVFQRMLAKEPADRYQSMSEVVAALAGLHEERAASGEGGGAAGGRREMSCVPPKVLLVEPSRTQAGIIRKYMHGAGVAEVVAATSGQEAMDAVRRERPDAIVCTMYLSDMTGVQLAQRVRGELHQDAPGFVLISTEGDGSEAGSLSKCGRALVLQKPFTPEKLAEALRIVANAPVGGPRVLIVDDSAAARAHERRVLAGLGVTYVVEAADGPQAVASAATQSFDLIVTDYNMPLMDGGKLVAYLRQNPATASVPVILVTTEQDSSKLDAVRRLGVAAICDKSFEPEAIRPILEKVVQPL